MPRFALALLACAVVLGSCSGSAAESGGHETPERAVVAWFDAIDAGEAQQASDAVHNGSLALILAIENDLDAATTASYLTDGVPLGVQDGYWSSFADGFSAFASRPISTLTVGESEPLTVEGQEYAVVPISSGPASRSIVFTRQRTDGSWEVDVVATLADGFATLMVDLYDGLDGSEDATTIRAAYTDTVVPAMWAAMSGGEFGDDFNRVALTLVGAVED
jgi:hypothetical protein